MSLTKDSSLVDKLLFLNKINIVLGFTLMFFHLSILDTYRETVWLIIGVSLVVGSALWSCVNYIVCSGDDIVNFIAKDESAKIIHLWIPYFATYIGMIIYLSYFAWYLGTTFFIALMAANFCSLYTEHRMKGHEEKDTN